MRLSKRLALLALSISALPMTAQASPWIYGVADREDAAVDENNPWVGDYGDEVTSLTPRRPRAPRPRPTPAPAPTPTPTPTPAPTPAPAPGNQTGAGILVAIVDTGIDLDHPEFAGRIAAGGMCFGGSSACPGTAALGDDNNGHGTHVAGIVAAAANGVGNTGVAPGASLLPVKVLDAGGSGSYSAVGSGISHAASKGARVINLSLGGPSASSTLLTPLQQAAATSVIVAAAGNSGNSLAPGYPAAYATQAGIVGSMIIVGSVNSQNQISSFSQTPGTGGCVTSGARTTCYRDVFLVARGEGIYSTYVGGGYAGMSGTSMATPYVAGVAARVLAASPYLTPQQVVSIMLQSATDLGAAGTDAVYGRGLVNLQAALAPVGGTSVATSGGSTSNYTGTGFIGGSSLSGVLATGLRQSTAAKDLVYFDAFGRDYRTNLAASATNASASLLGVMEQSLLTGKGVAVAAPGYSVAGFVTEEAPGLVASAGFAAQTTHELSEVVIRASLSESAHMVVGHNASPVGQVNALDLAASEAYDGLFLSASAMNSPFLALTPQASFLGGGVRLDDGVTIAFAHAAFEETADEMLADERLTVDEQYAYLNQDLLHQRSARNTMAAVNWQFAPWGVAGVNVALTEEENSLLGTQEQGALALTSDAVTASIGFGARFDLGDDWSMTATWSRGETEATPLAGGLFQNLSSIESQAYGVAIAKTGVIGKSDTIGFAISRPLHITTGSAVFTASTGVTEEREILYTTEVLNLASSTPETDYEIGYTAKLDDDLTLQASAMYQQDVGGEAGADAVAAFVTLKGTW